MNDTGDFVQIKGPFPANTNLYDKILSTRPKSDGIYHFGLQAKPGTKIILSETESSPASKNYFIVGKSGTFEFEDVRLTYIVFPEKQNCTTIIDCLIY